MPKMPALLYPHMLGRGHIIPKLIHPPILVPGSASMTRSPTGSICILSIDRNSSQSSHLPGQVVHWYSGFRLLKFTFCSFSRNTYNKQIVKVLPHVFELCDKDDRVRVVILTAEPTAAAYCSGVCFKNFSRHDLG